MNTIGNTWLKPAMPDQRDRSHHNAAEEDETLFGLARGLVASLWRWRLLILAVVVAGLSAAWFALQSMSSTYVAHAELYFDFSRQSVVSDLPTDAVAPSTAMLTTEMQILTSRNLMNVVVEELNLIEDPEFSPWLPAPGEATNGPEVVSEDDARTTAVSSLLSQVRVSLVPNSYVFTITVETLSPEKSATIANGIADLFIRERTERRLDASEDAISWLERRTANLQDRVREAENKVAQQRALATPGGDSSLASTAVQIASLRERLATVEADARRLVNLEERLASAGETPLDAEIEAALREVSSDLADEIEAAGASSDTEGRDLDALLMQARAGVATAARDAHSEAARIRTDLEGLLKVYSDRTTEAQELRDAEREAAASLAAYEAMLERLKGRVALDALDPFWPEATIISPAVPSSAPASPDRELILALGGVGSLALASGLALLLNTIFPVIASARDLERMTGVPIVARLPLPRNRLPKLQRQLRRRPSSGLAESLRSLRIAIALESGDGTSTRFLLLTSAEKDEGKSATGYLLAQSYSQAGRKVLLIDADPISAGLFGKIPSGPGLNALLRGEVDPHESILQISGIDVLYAPKALRDDADLFAHGGERTSLEKIATGYDVALIIAPPVGMLPDARILARLSDAVFVVVRRQSSRPAAVAAAVDLLLSGGSSRVGTVLLSRDSG